MFNVKCFYTTTRLRFPRDFAKNHSHHVVYTRGLAVVEQRRVAGYLGLAIFRQTAEPKSSPGLVNFFRNSLQLSWILGYSDLIVSFSRLQWLCLYLIVLWRDTRKECTSHPTTSAVNIDPLSRRSLLSTFFVLRSSDISYLLSNLYQLVGAIIHWCQRYSFTNQTLR